VLIWKKVPAESKKHLKANAGAARKLGHDCPQVSVDISACPQK